jgi:hypothetical protein
MAPQKFFVRTRWGKGARQRPKTATANSAYFSIKRPVSAAQKVRLLPTNIAPSALRRHDTFMAAGSSAVPQIREGAIKT